MPIDNTIIETPYIYYNSGASWFIYPAADEADESEILLRDLPPLQADHLLAHGFRCVIEGINDFDTIGR